MKGININVSFWGILCLIFITLKLTHVIDWSWWWVLAPIWMPTVVGIVFVIIILLLVALGVITWSTIRKIGKKK